MHRFITPIVALIFIGLKWSTIGVRLSDTNIYVLIAKRISEGAMVYRDIVFTNAPLYPYIAVFYRLITGGKLELFYWAAPFEAVGTMALLALSLRQLKVRGWIVTLACLSYLFSTMVLATTDHSTGVFTAVFFAMLAYWCILTKRWWLSGIFLAAMFMTKGYTAPLLMGMGGYILFFERQHGWKVVLSGLSTILVCLTPTIYGAWPQFWDQIVGYSLSRPAGLSKGAIFMFFVSHDWWLFLLGIISLVWWKYTWKGWGLVACGGVFLLLYRDVYYFYLNILGPFLLIGGALGIEHYVRKKNHEMVPIMLWTLAVLAIAINISGYFTTFASMQRVQNMDELTQAVKKANPSAIGGDADIMPAIAYETGLPVVKNIIDTNTTFFRTKRYTATAYTDALLKTDNAILITYGASYPVYNIQEPIFSEIVDKERIRANCAIIHTQAVQAENMANSINIWKCTNNE